MSGFNWGAVYSHLSTGSTSGQPSTSSKRSQVWVDFPNTVARSVQEKEGNDVWNKWERQNHDQVESLRRRESPMKKRHSRRARGGGEKRGRSRGGRSSNQNRERSREPPEAPNAPDTPMMEWDVDGDEGFGYSLAYSAQPNAEDDAVNDYISLFQSGALQFILIATFLYVVQGWNPVKKEPNDKWYHFQGRPVGDNINIVCMCPTFAQKRNCVHRDTYIEFREERFCDVEGKMFRDGRVVWFWREMDIDDPERGGKLWLNRFSVKTGRDGEDRVAKRAFVTFLGSDAGVGKWSCSHCLSGCAHHSAAQSFFCEVLGIELSADLEKESLDNDVLLFGDSNSVSHSENSISYLLIRPPAWAELPSDQPLYPRPSPACIIPSRIPLTEKSNRTLCGLENPSTPDMTRTVKNCTVYTLTGSLTCDIELVQCPMCPYQKHCFMGPDTRNIGLFNYNNSVLFTHEVLDDYTSRYTGSETPFMSFVEAMARVYKGRGCSFVKEDLFRSVWFAYVTIQEFSHDMCCTRCGDALESLIWDGVTLAFGKKHLSESLSPPTLSVPNAPSRSQNYPRRPQLIPEERRLPVCRLIRNWVKKAQLKKATTNGGFDESDDEKEVEDTTTTPLRLEDFEIIVGRLMLVSEELAQLFTRTFSLHAITDARMKRLYGTLFEQVAAEEYGLQMINARSLQPLQEFTSRPCWETASRLINIPALYKVLEAEFKSSGRYPRDLVEASGWMCRRATAVLGGLSREEPVLIPEEERTDVDDWRKTGCCYSFPKICERPKYPNLSGDGTADKLNKSERGGKCAKYYSTYGEKRLTEDSTREDTQSAPPPALQQTMRQRMPLWTASTPARRNAGTAA
ncbi:hypothetical protein V5O48_017147 [Marasmius crinis-equi]|uniref:HMG domain-containing protein n=1 Tax=Marasmius crinis-equi TaxID=585013 RepID=A0ABR3EQ05_9AGAR